MDNMIFEIVYRMTPTSADIVYCQYTDRWLARAKLSELMAAKTFPNLRLLAVMRFAPPQTTEELLDIEACLTNQFEWLKP